MSPIKPRKLQLNRSTLRKLSHEDLENVPGGAKDIEPRPRTGTCSGGLPGDPRCRPDCIYSSRYSMCEICTANVC